MTIFVVVLHVIVCLLLIAVILFQVGRGHGLSSSSFGTWSGIQSVFGTKTADFLTKATTVVAILFVLTCLTLDVIQARRGRSLMAGKDATSQVDIDKIRKALSELETKKKEEVAEEVVKPTEGEEVEREVATTETQRKEEDTEFPVSEKFPDSVVPENKVEEPKKEVSSVPTSAEKSLPQEAEAKPEG